MSAPTRERLAIVQALDALGYAEAAAAAAWLAACGAREETACDPRTADALDVATHAVVRALEAVRDALEHCGDRPER